MPKRLNYSDRKKMLEARDKGLTTTQIKAQFGFTDDRTLKRHLRLAEQEQEARLVKVEILKDALASHLAGIRSLIEQWQSVLTVPPIQEVSPEIITRMRHIESNPLFNSLKEHLPSPTLWRNYAIWDNKLKEYINGCEKLMRDIEEEAGKWEKVRRVNGSFSEPILKRLHENAVGKEPKAQHRFEKRVEYRDKQGRPVPEFETLVVDGTKTIEANDALAYGGQYEVLSDQVLGSEVGASLIGRFNDLKALEQKMYVSLQEILLRSDYIMYTCKLCPGQAKLLR